MRIIIIGIGFLIGSVNLLYSQAGNEGEKKIEADSTVQKMNSYASEVKPVPLNLKQIVESIGYPLSARLNEIEGTVVLKVLVDKTGKYETHEVVQEVHPSLRKKVEKKIHLIRFSPGIVNGTPARFWVTVPFHFSLMPTSKRGS